MFIPGGFQTMPSKANDVNWDDDDLGGSSFTRKPGTKPDDDVPF
jgi:replicative DNA helicase